VTTAEISRTARGDVVSIESVRIVPSPATTLSDSSGLVLKNRMGFESYAAPRAPEAEQERG
jgi:hypothetical protein